MKYVNQAIRKVDAMSLVTGKPVYTGDMVPANTLMVKMLRSPHAHALIEEIDTAAAMKVPGVVAIFTYKDVPASRFTTAGQTYPEPSPYDRLILDRRLRCVGDPVALVAAETEAAAAKAAGLIKVKYQVLEPLLDFTKAKDNPILVHPEEDFKALCPVGADNRRNLCSVDCMENGDVEAELATCPVVIERTFYTKANIRVIKPRIGGGFGAKQSAVSEVYPAFVTMKTGRPACLCFTRQESQANGSPRHQMRVTVRIGADEDGTIRALDVKALSNAGAYGEHGPTTVGLVGTKSISLYGSLKAARFSSEVVYSNTMGAGAYRGYGATQGIFAVESTVNELAAQLGMDPCAIREKNMVRLGQTFAMYYGENCTSCTLDKCMETAKKMMDWDNKAPRRVLENGHIRSVGVAMAMQGSGISGVDIGSVEIRLNDDGFYTLLVGCTDMGTGCDTILTQMAADCLDCPMENISVRGVDTDQSPYDCGSYASSTTYVTGMAVVKACAQLREKILAQGAKMLDVPADTAEFDGKRVFVPGTDKEVSLSAIGYASFEGHARCISACESHSSPVSPPPMMVGMAEIDLDPETGKIQLVDYVAAVDCGTVVNKNLARVQTEGGIVQGIGMALYEDIQYTKAGRMMNDSFLQYRIPTRLEAGTIRVEFESSYEPSGPFGAKSIGELVINTPAPAILGAIQNATGVAFHTLPVKPEDVVMALRNKAE